MKLPLLFASVFFLLTGTPDTVSAAPSNSEPSQTMNRLSLSGTEKLLRSMGVIFEEIEHGAFSIEMEGFRVVFYNHFDSVQLYAGFSGYAGASSKTINKWNREKRFSRAYLDDAGDPCLEADLMVRGGVTQENIKQFLDTFKISLKAFSDSLDAGK